MMFSLFFLFQIFNLVGHALRFCSFLQLDMRGQRSEDRGQMTEDRSQKWEVEKYQSILYPLHSIQNYTPSALRLEPYALSPLPSTLLNLKLFTSLWWSCPASLFFILNSEIKPLAPCILNSAVGLLTSICYAPFAMPIFSVTRNPQRETSYASLLASQLSSIIPFQLLSLLPSELL